MRIGILEKENKQLKDRIEAVLAEVKIENDVNKKREKSLMEL